MSVHLERWACPECGAVHDVYLDEDGIAPLEKTLCPDCLRAGAMVVCAKSAGDTIWDDR